MSLHVSEVHSVVFQGVGNAAFYLSVDQLMGMHGVSTVSAAVSICVCVCMDICFPFSWLHT